MDQITKNFTLEEFTRSETAEKLGIPNEPNEEEKLNISLLCEHVLQPLRDIIGRPIHISSGFRSKELNKHLGGVSDSQHMLGQAADISVPGYSLERVFGIIRADFDYDQVIYENHPHNPWIHVSYDQRANRKMPLFASFDRGHAEYFVLAPNKPLKITRK